MKKLFCLSVAAVIALTACSSDEGAGLNENKSADVGGVNADIREASGEVVTIVFSSAPEAGEVTDDSLEQARSMIQTRMGTMNIDGEVSADSETRQITVALPHCQFRNHEELANKLIEVALLAFHEGHEREGTLILTGADVRNAGVTFCPFASQYQVSLEFNESGAQAFSDATARLAPESGVISIWLDDVLISAPTVESHITDGEAVISGDFTAQQTQSLADTINRGALPYALVVESIDVI
jgi:hypothetical protein